MCGRATDVASSARIPLPGSPTNSSPRLPRAPTAARAAALIRALKRPSAVPVASPTVSARISAFNALNAHTRTYELLLGTSANNAAAACSLFNCQRMAAEPASAAMAIAAAAAGKSPEDSSEVCSRSVSGTRSKRASAWAAPDAATTSTRSSRWLARSAFATIPSSDAACACVLTSRAAPCSVSVCCALSGVEPPNPASAPEPAPGSSLASIRATSLATAPTAPTSVLGTRAGKEVGEGLPGTLSGPGYVVVSRALLSRSDRSAEMTLPQPPPPTPMPPSALGARL
mmetsp:Transcript_18685/g.43569  ORF Transcript_18685/g.43569 Transcript_18685/m.43569 type:complete len:286 (-) Transcript_18685:3571-4428(-)